ncbi:5'-3' exonuclease H3TH domain-containing protein, partial [Staphylococcus aureus]|uniref:5'-3' exonuclease H3TH domain-containing protein n=1 Tax=Staphylococcus aureus TaxID=1280 RepID=UPI0039BDA810
ALRGDPSDNIPGVKGIGEKTAGELIKGFTSLDKLYEAIASDKIGNKIKPRDLELLKAQEKEARMSYKLAVIDCNAPIEVDVPSYELDAPHLQQVVKLFQELEFRSLLGKLPKAENRRIGESEVGGVDVVEDT